MGSKAVIKRAQINFGETQLNAYGNLQIKTLKLFLGHGRARVFLLRETPAPGGIGGWNRFSKNFLP